MLMKHKVNYHPLKRNINANLKLIIMNLITGYRIKSRIIDGYGHYYPEALSAVVTTFSIGDNNDEIEYEHFLTELI